MKKTTAIHRNRLGNRNNRNVRMRSARNRYDGNGNVSGRFPMDSKAAQRSMIWVSSIWTSYIPQGGFVCNSSTLDDLTV